MISNMLRRRPPHFKNWMNPILPIRGYSSSEGAYDYKDMDLYRVLSLEKGAT